VRHPIIWFVALLTLLIGVNTASAGQKEHLNAQPGDSIIYHGHKFVVPEPGNRVELDILYEDGSDFAAIETRLNGEVYGDGVDPDPDPNPRPILACNDAAFTLFDRRWYGIFQWRVKDSSIPAANNKANVRNAIWQGLQNWEFETNDCGRPDTIAPNGTLGASTTGNTNVNANNTCDANSATDGINIVSFADITTGNPLAATCTYARQAAPSGGETTWATDEFGTVLDTDYVWVTGGCSGSKWYVESVMTHEHGHHLGLDHPGTGTSTEKEQQHGNLTMSTQIAACSTKEQTLGLGDMLGAEALGY